MSEHTPGQRAAAAIIDSPAILDVLCGATASQGLMGRRDNEGRQQAIDYLAELIDRETAAPELLEALVEIGNDPITFDEKHGTDDSTRWRACQEIARAAIASATGEPR